MAYVPPEYPGEIPGFAEIWPPVDDVDWMFTTAWDAMVKELRAALTELGTLPKGAHADVKTRLNVQQHKIADDDGDSYEDVEKTADVDEAVTYLKNILVRKFNDDGILDLPKQSRCRAYRTTPNQSIPRITSTKCELNAETYDNQNEWDHETNYRYTAKKAGPVMVVGSVYLVTLADGKMLQVSIYKNGGEVTRAKLRHGAAGSLGTPIVDIIYLNANDYLELWLYHEHTGAVGLYAGAAYSFMSIHKLS